MGIGVDAVNQKRVFYFNKMIHYQELRVGNWVEYLGEEFQILGITYPEKEEYWENYRIRLDDHDHTTVIHQMLEPISITENRLKRLQFYNGILIIDEIGEIEYNEFHDERLTLCVGSYCSNGQRIPIKYVHQLQNLFYSLTGKELNYE